MPATRARATTVTLPCPICRDGDVHVAVVVEGPDLAYGYDLGAYTENGQTIECNEDDCVLSEDQITDLCERAEERALEEYRA